MVVGRGSAVGTCAGCPSSGPGRRVAKRLPTGRQHGIGSGFRRRPPALRVDPGMRHSSEVLCGHSELSVGTGGSVGGSAVQERRAHSGLEGCGEGCEAHLPRRRETVWLRRRRPSSSRAYAQVHVSRSILERERCPEEAHRPRAYARVCLYRGSILERERCASGVVGVALLRS
jgi:hypothetical protein